MPKAVSIVAEQPATQRREDTVSAAPSAHTTRRCWRSDESWRQRAAPEVEKLQHPLRLEVHHNHIAGVTAPTEMDGNTPCYPCYTLHLQHVEDVFGNLHSGWCRTHPPARAVFGWGVLSIVARFVVRAHHDRFYRTGDLIELYSGAELLRFLHFGYRDGHPRMFTYTLHKNGTLHFSETGQGFFRDKFSKHAIQARASSRVRCAGEFHIQPTKPSEAAEEDGRAHWIVLDNNSGTYAPDKVHLERLQELLQKNFPDLRVEVFDHTSEQLHKYKEEMEEIFGENSCGVQEDAGDASQQDSGKKRKHVWFGLRTLLPFFRPALGVRTAIQIAIVGFTVLGAGFFFSGNRIMT